MKPQILLRPEAEIEEAYHLYTEQRDGLAFKQIRGNPSMFCAMKIKGGMIAWNNGADIDTDGLYYNLKPAWMEDAGAVRAQD